MYADLYISWFIILSPIGKFQVTARKNAKIKSKQNSDLENNYALLVNHTDNVSYDESHKGKPCVLYIAWGSPNYSTFQVETSALSQRVSMSHVLPTTPPEIYCKNKVLFQDSYTANKCSFILGLVWVFFCYQPLGIVHDLLMVFFTLCRLARVKILLKWIISLMFIKWL